MTNAIWLQINDREQKTTDLVNNGGFGIIYLQLGQFESVTNEISHYNTDTEISESVSYWKKLGYTVMGWVISHENYGGYIQFSTVEQRQRLTEAVVSEVKKYGFDGFKSDIELWGNWDSYLSLLNQFTDALNAIGKKHDVNINIRQSHRLTYYVGGDGMTLAQFKTLRCNLLVPMFYDGAEYTVDMKKQQFDFICSNSHLPLLAGITSQYPNVLNQEIVWMTESINAKSYPQIKGVALWWNAQMSDNEWEAWNNWTLKDRYVSVIAPVVGVTQSLSVIAPVVGVTQSFLSLFLVGCEIILAGFLIVTERKNK